MALKRITLKRITLKQLARKFKRNPRLFVNVLKSPKMGLKAKHLTLSEKDMKKLQRWLRRVYCMSGKKLLMVYQTLKRKDDWPPID